MSDVSKPWYKKWWGITLIVVLAIGVIGNLSGSDEPEVEATAITEVEVTTEPEVTTTEAPTTTVAPTTTTTEATTTTELVVTVEDFADLNLALAESSISEFCDLVIVLPYASAKDAYLEGAGGDSDTGFGFTLGDVFDELWSRC